MRTLFSFFHTIPNITTIMWRKNAKMRSEVGLSMNKYNFAILGGDRKIAYTAFLLHQKGYPVICYKTAKIPQSHLFCSANSLKEAVRNAHIIICGISDAFTDLAELQRCIRKSQIIFGAMLPESFCQNCEERKISCYDFMKDSCFLTLNAIATAEGAIMQAMINSDVSLHQKRILVLGYGRCAKVLADKLRGLSAKLCIATDSKSELSQAKALGFDTLSISELKSHISCYYFIFNTIPSVILTKPILKCINPNALIIDIASGRGGIDYDYASKTPLKIFHCRAIPENYAFMDTAEHITEYVLNTVC